MELIRSVLLHRHRPSPHYSWVGSCITFFEACSAFTRVTTCRLAESPYATLYTEGSDGFVASTAAPIATGWSDPVPGRVYLPLWSSAFHGALEWRCYNSNEVCWETLASLPSRSCMPTKCRREQSRTIHTYTRILEVEFDSKAVHTVVQDRCAYVLTLSILELNSIFRNCTRNQSNRRDCQSG